MTAPPRTFATECDLGFKNLIVSGCSFTKNFDLAHVHAWPYYLRDLGGFESVYDYSCSGAGNQHIHHSVVAGIELDRPNPADSLVVVMWSGYDRDDFLVDPQTVDQSNRLCAPQDYFDYTENVSLGMTGGLLGAGNLIVNIENIKKVKSKASRALENHLLIVGLAGYLNAHGFCYVFTEFSTPGTLKDTNFDPVEFLPTKLQHSFQQQVRQLVPNLGDWARPELSYYQQHHGGDGYHPDSNHHLDWTRSVLLPYMASHTRSVV